MLYLKRLFILISFVIVLSLTACGHDHDTGHDDSHDEPVAAKVVTATTARQPLVHQAAGTIQAKNAGTISAKLMGIVLDVPVNEGERVKSGDLLVSIDTRQVSAQLEQAQAAVAEARQAAAAADAALESAQANADLANATFERYQKLLAEDSVSRQEYDEVVSRNRQAQSALSQFKDMATASRYRVKQAESGLSAASVSHGDATVQAPFDGIVSQKFVEPGDLATPGKPLLTIERSTGFEMAVNLPETLFKSVSLGQSIIIRIASLGDISIQGKVATIAPSADQRSRSFLVKVDLPEDAPVHAGMFARADFTVGEENLLLIPSGAIRHEGHLTGVFILDDENVARFRLIRTGRDLDGGVEVLSGMKSGMRFVVDPPPVLVDGTPVEVLS